MTSNYTKTKVEEFCNKLSVLYKIDYSIQEGENSFISWIVVIRDPQKIGLDFNVCFNDNGEISTLDSSVFDLSRINIAEYYTQEELYNIILAILNGNFEIKRSWIFRKYKIAIKLKAEYIFAPATTNNHMMIVKQFGKMPIFGSYEKL